MGRINRKCRERRNFNKKIEKEKKRINATPLYDMNGKVIRPGFEQKRKKRRIILSVVMCLLAIIYLPQLFIKSFPWDFYTDKQSVHHEVKYDSSAIRSCNNLLRSSPGDDFDGDGMTNAEEIEYSTNPWDVDTDGDGAYDSYEVRTSNTIPTHYDKSVMVDEQIKSDERNGGNGQASSPVKIDDVILWAKDYQSKARGTVVKTLKGYRICGGFEGYAKFPKRYAYSVSNGIHKLLPEHSDVEGAWRVSDGQTIEVFDTLMEKTVRVAFMSHAIYLDENPFTKAVAFILPGRGIISSMEMLKIDAEPDTSDIVTADIVLPPFDTSDMYRYSVNENKLTDYNNVMRSIDNKSCVATSLYSKTNGESIVIIYGYTQDGRLLYADAETLQPLGQIRVKEMSKKTINEEGKMVPIVYFDYETDGFSSLNGDRICFFAVSQGNNTMGSSVNGSTVMSGAAADTDAHDTAEGTAESSLSVPADTESVAAAQETDGQANSGQVNG